MFFILYSPLNVIPQVKHLIVCSSTLLFVFSEIIPFSASSLALACSAQCLYFLTLASACLASLVATYFYCMASAATLSQLPLQSVMSLPSLVQLELGFLQPLPLTFRLHQHLFLWFYPRSLKPFLASSARADALFCSSLNLDGLPLSLRTSLYGGLLVFCLGAGAVPPHWTRRCSATTMDPQVPVNFSEISVLLKTASTPSFLCQTDR